MYTRPSQTPLVGLYWVAVVRNDGRDTDLSNFGNRTTIGYARDASQSHNGNSTNSNLKSEELVRGKEMNGSVQENSINHSKKTAKIHDFCFGIPFGGLVFTGGVVGFIFSSNPATLSNGVLFGGALLAFSTISLRVWRQGKSSLPFILGQADKESISNWLLCCHQCCNVLLLLLCGIVWGNPPPKKLKVSAVEAS